MIESVYVHIPFCKNICTYCDFCKFFYQEKLVDEYLDALNQEMEETYQKEKLKTIYIGGGTPSSLNQDQLKRLFKILKQLNTEELQEFTFEMNPEDISVEKLEILKANGVTRISIGHQTNQIKYLKELGRTTPVTKESIELVKKYFQNINVDLMYGFKNQTKEEFLEDIEYLMSLDIQHISTYSLMLEEHTKLYIENYQRLEEELDAWMYQTLQEQLSKNNFYQYEISNFSKKGYESKHNLTYWNNQKYYGFGLGASGYIKNIRYTNTRSMNEYKRENRVLEKEEISKEDEMIYEMILGLRKVEGVAKIKFFQKYHRKIEQSFDIIEMLNQGLLEDTGDFIRIPKDKLYLENSILIHFLEVKNYE